MESEMTEMFSVSSSSISELFLLQQELEQEKMEADEKLKLVKDELQSRYLERAQDKLHQEGKDFGSATVRDSGYKVGVTLRKRVEWDAGQLLKALNSLDEDTARHYAEIKYSVTEAKYNNAPPEIKAALSNARTVHLQGVSVKIEEDKDA